MLNPLFSFNKELFHKLIETGNRFFIRQTYSRGFDHFDPKQTRSFLISHYKELNPAQSHYNAIEKDGRRFLYDIEKTDHLSKLEIAASQPSGFKIFAAILAEKKWNPSERMRVKFRRYIDTELNWMPKKKEILNVDLFIQNGELFIELQYMLKQIKLPLTNIEKY